MIAASETASTGGASTITVSKFAASSPAALETRMHQQFGGIGRNLPGGDHPQLGHHRGFRMSSSEACPATYSERPGARSMPNSLCRCPRRRSASTITTRLSTCARTAPRFLEMKLLPRPGLDPVISSELRCASRSAKCKRRAQSAQALDRVFLRINDRQQSRRRRPRLAMQLDLGLAVRHRRVHRQTELRLDDLRVFDDHTQRTQHPDHHHADQQAEQQAMPRWRPDQRQPACGRPQRCR
jgi:hypothetical protein